MNSANLNGMNIVPGLPCQRTIVAIDIERSTATTNPMKGQLRNAMYELFEEALLAGGITEEHRDPFIDRGDGVLALIHPVDQVPKTNLLTKVIPRLSALLASHGARWPLRLRAVIHTGELQYDVRGCFGEALDIAFRLLDAAKMKGRLRQTGRPLALVVSHDIYRSIIRHGYDGIDMHLFEPLVRVHIAGQQHRGWVHVPYELVSHERGPAANRSPFLRSLQGIADA